MGTAIRKHVKDFVALVVLFVIAAAITLFILSNQNFSLPGWVPVLGKDTYSLKAEFSTAQAVTPGQGQSVNIAGVPIGKVTNVQLVNGRAVVTMAVEPKYRSRIYPNATMLLRPKTGLKDMIIALDPGTAASGPALGSGATIPVSHTQPDVNLDEFLSVLDADTRDYLVLLLNGGGQGLVGNGRTLAQVLRRFDPIQRNIAKITSELQTRQQNMKRVTTSLQLLLNELGSKDTNLAAFVESSNSSLSNFAAQEANLKETINLLPGALSATNSAMQSLNTTSKIAGPTLAGLLPAAQGLAAAQAASVKFFNQTQNDAPNVFENQLRPFAVKVQPALNELNPASKNLNAATSGLTKTIASLNYALDELAYDPRSSESDGSKAPPYLFDLFWAGHNTNAMLGNQDAAGPVRQGVLLSSGGGYRLAYTVAERAASLNNPFLKLTFDLLRAPNCRGSGACP